MTAVGWRGLFGVGVAHGWIGAPGRRQASGRVVDRKGSGMRIVSESVGGAQLGAGLKVVTLGRAVG